MIENLNQFKQELMKTTKEIESRVRNVIAKQASISYSRVIDLTPVADFIAPHPGRLVANWVVSIDSPSTSYLKIQDMNKSLAYNNLSNDLSRFTRSGSTIYFQNNAPYAGLIEFSGGSPNKAPEGMLRIGVAALPGNLNEALRKALK